MADSSDHGVPKLQAVEQAIQLALDSEWEEAVRVNQDLLDRFGPDPDTHNRLGKALMELGRLEEAQEAYQATLTLNPTNPIALRQLDKLRERATSKAPLAPVSTSLDVKSFTEEPGKTTVTRLIPAPGLDPATAAPGDPIEIVVDADQVSVRTGRGASLGVLEPRVAQRLRRLVESGNRYSGAVTHVDGQMVQVILREVYQDPSQAGTTSFPVHGKAREMDYRPYTKETLLARDAAPIADDEDEAEPALRRPPRAAEEPEEGFAEFEEADEVDAEPSPDESDEEADEEF